MVLGVFFVGVSIMFVFFLSMRQVLWRIYCSGVFIFQG